MIATVSRLIDLIRESQLLNAAQLEHLTGSLQGRYAEPHPLAQELVRRGWLTDYQLRQIIRGKGHELILGPYRILEPVGQGCMGVVFKGQHRQTGRIVAVKVIRQERRADHQALLRFRREIAALTQLSHPNIVRACDVAEVGVAHYYAMEFIEGTNLERVVARVGPLPIAAACDYIRQAALGLQHAHERGLIHRDMKPSNLLVTVASTQDAPSVSGLSAEARQRFGHWGMVKILDLGLVLLQNPPETSEHQLQLTREGWALGSVDYMAPEQITNPHGVDIRADLYSLGCIFHELLTGRPPFPNGTLIDKLAAHKKQTPPPVAQLRPEVPAVVGSVVTRLLAKRPEDRYQQPRELSSALAGILVRLDRSTIAWDWQPPKDDRPDDQDPGTPQPERPAEVAWPVLGLLIGGIVALLMVLLVLLKVP